MGKFNFIKTEDGSTGLYDINVNDIYHSKTGALKESMDKFINPIPDYIKNKNNINILDICYGIGYNSKSFLNNTNSKKINIDCLEINKELVILSPFIKDGISNIDIKLHILSEIIKILPNLSEFESIFFSEHIKGSMEFLEPSILNLMRHIKNEGYTNNHYALNYRFLHNIYYNYISLNNIKDIKVNNNKEIKIRYFFNDARRSISLIDNEYDVVFLDGFSPQKDPTLWTIDFLSSVKNKLNNNSIIVSYSKSTPFRSALLELGFNVGKTYIDNIDMGTIASLNKNNITNPLNDYDLKLISTRSGITYKDADLISTAQSIIKEREIEMRSSDRISHTQFLKSFYKHY